MQVLEVLGGERLGARRVIPIVELLSWQQMRVREIQRICWEMTYFWSLLQL